MGGDNLHCCYREQVAYALYAKFREPRLYRMAVSGDWDLIPDRCQSHPKEASFVHKYAPNDTALHRMLRTQVTDGLDDATVEGIVELKLAAASAILETYREAASVQDAFGRTPLHLACMDLKNCGTDVAELVLRAYSRAASSTDVEGRTPLHFLCARTRDEIPLHFLEQIVACSPHAVLVKDKTNDTPVDLVNQRKDEIENADDVLKVFSSAPGKV